MAVRGAVRPAAAEEGGTAYRADPRRAFDYESQVCDLLGLHVMEGKALKMKRMRGDGDGADAKQRKIAYPWRSD